MSRRSPRVFVGLVEKAGYYSRLASGFRQLGVKCTVCFITDHPFGYAEDCLETRLTRWTRRAWAEVERARQTGSVLKLAVRRLICFLARLALFLEMATTHDVFVFGFGTTFFRGLDLRVLRVLGKKVVIAFNGSDHRPPYLNGLAWGDDASASLRKVADEARRMKSLVTMLERNADVVVAHHLSAQFHEVPFVPFMHVGVPCNVPECETPRPRDPSQPIRILHAPSMPWVKGTDRIRIAVANLTRRGYPIEFVEISGRPNSEVLDELRRCDLVVDELYSDARMAALASEAAMFAKPVVVAGYASDDMMRIPGRYEVSDFPPVLYCRPEEVERAIETLINDADARQKLGQGARRFVEEHWRADLVAARILNLVDGAKADYPSFDPSEIRYFHGFGMTEDRLLDVLKTYVATFGESALLLDDKPLLLHEIRRFLAHAPADSGAR